MPDQKIEKKWITKEDGIGQEFHVIVRSDDNTILADTVVNFPLFTKSDFIRSNGEKGISEIENIAIEAAKNLANKVSVT